MERINLNDDLQSAIIKMADGNPGALTVLMRLLQPEANEIDPDNLMGGLGNILSLDSIGIYGTDIYVLMNDICENNMVKFITVLRSHQLGLIGADELRNACGRQDRSGKKMINILALHEKVKSQLPKFADINIDK